MGLFGKIKNIFYDEEIVEVEVPSREEIKQDEKPRIEEVRLPKREVTRPREEETQKPVSPVYTEREQFKTEPTFKFPVIDEEEPVRTRTRPNILDLERTTPPKRDVQVPTKPEVRPERSYSERNYNDKSYSERSTAHTNDKSTTKTFRPSPVISPVYGVLDKNYKKEEIIERQQHTIRHNPSEMNYDSVRRKAYGTLEDELESTLSKISSRKDEVMQTIEEVEKLDTESNSKSIEDLLNEIEGNRDMSIGEIEEKIKDRIEEEETNSPLDKTVSFKEEFDRRFQETTKEIPNVPDLPDITEEIKATKPKEDFFEEPIVKEEKTSKIEEDDGFDKTLEHDLFNLIDSMYEEREGE